MTDNKDHRAEYERLATVGNYLTKGVVYRLVYTAGLLASLYLLGSIIAHTFYPTPTDATDMSASMRSGLQLYTDYGTGCQYVATPEGHITPRLADSGDQVCEGPSVQ